MSSNKGSSTPQTTSTVVAKADHYYQHVKELIVSTSWEPLRRFAQDTIISLMSRIEVGYLRVLSKEHVYEFGKKGSPLRSEIKVVNDSFWVRLLLFSDLGFAEAYMLGDVTCDDLVTFFKIFVENSSCLDELSGTLSFFFNVVGYVMNSQFANTISNAINNISAHYDISNEMFASFLSADMTYSSAVFENQQDTLEEAQYRKLRMIIKKARICKDDHVLEIGCGWGSFAIEAVKSTGCKVTALTLSVQQKILAEERIANAGLSSNITVLLCDYRKLPASHQFDKIVSIEMIEAVGSQYLATYFECCDKFLKKEGGIGVFQVITMPETRYHSYCREVGFIRKYIFPGSHCPTVTTLVEAIYKGSRGRLIIDNIENIGPHYARTLRLWRLKFLEVFDSCIRPSLLKSWPNMNNEEIVIFRNKWEFYFAYCEGGFMNGILGNIQLVLTREGNKALFDGIPYVMN